MHKPVVRRSTPSVFQRPLSAPAHGRRGPLALLLAAAAILAAGCTSGPSPASKAAPSPSIVQPQRYTVSVDASPQSIPLVADAFFPSQLALHPGDSVTFKEEWTGEPHTVTLGTLVDQAASVSSSPSPSPARVSPLTAGSAGLPDLFPAGFPGGRGDVPASAAQPCFLASGSPPLTGACPQVAQPDFNGSQTFYNSGWLAEGSSFTVTVSATTPVGTYHVRDLAHPVMAGEVQVVPRSQPVPSPSAVAAAGAAELARAVQAQAPAAAEAAAVTTTLVAGITEAGVTNTFIAAFGPATVTATSGSTLTWNLYGRHALALDPPATATGLLTQSADGSVHINTTAVNHIGGAAPPTGVPTRPVSVNGGSYGGTGFHNSGLLDSVPPGLISYTLKFSAPGTYTVRCLVHPAMTETVNVTP